MTNLTTFMEEEDEVVEEVIPPKPVHQHKPVSKRKYKKQYINNPDFFASICKWQDDLAIDPTTPMPSYLGECFMKLAENWAHKSPYHTEIEDQKSHAVLTCCMYARNFDRTKSQNPFAYFTTYVSNAFAGVHNKQKEFIDFKFNLIKEICESEGLDYSHYLNDEEETFE